MKIGKEFHWEMAHRLPFHTGGCRNIHGHSYRLFVELEGVPDENGMVLDYFIINDLVDPVIASLDHSFLCNSADTLIRQFLESTDLKAVYVDFQTTAENLAVWLCERFSEVFLPYKNLSQLTIRVSETERSFAEVATELRVSIPNQIVFEHQAHMLE